MIYVKELYLYHIVKYKSLYLNISNDNIIITNDEININLNLNNITALNRKSNYNDSSYEFITLELKKSEKVNYINNEKKIKNINTISFCIDTKDLNRLYYFNNNKCLLDYIKDYKNPNNQIIPYWGFLFNYNQRKIIQYILLFFNFFYFLWTVYQLVYLFPNLYLSFKNNVLYYLGDLKINILNINSILLKVDYIVKIFKLDGFKDLINGILFLLYPLKILYNLIINIYNNVLVNIIYTIVINLTYYIKYIISIFNIYKFTNFKTNISGVPNVTNIYYQNPRLILNMLDYITKPFRILYVLVNLLGTSIKTSYEILKQKYFIKNNMKDDKYNL